MYLGARSDLDAAESAGSLAQYNEHHDSAEKKQLYTVVFGAAGAALVVAGVVRYQLRSSGTDGWGAMRVTDPARGGWSRSISGIASRASISAIASSP